MWWPAASPCSLPRPHPLLAKSNPAKSWLWQRQPTNVQVPYLRCLQWRKLECPISTRACGWVLLDQRDCHDRSSISLPAQRRRRCKRRTQRRCWSSKVMIRTSSGRISSLLLSPPKRLAGQQSLAPLVYYRKAEVTLHGRRSVSIHRFRRCYVRLRCCLHKCYSDTVIDPTIFG